MLKIGWKFMVMQSTRTFGYFFDIQHFKITRITSGNIRNIADIYECHIISEIRITTYVHTSIAQSKFSITSYLTMLPMKFNIPNRPNQFNVSLFIRRKNKSFRCFRAPLENLQISLRSKDFIQNFTLGILSRIPKDV